MTTLAHSPFAFQSKLITFEVMASGKTWTDEQLIAAVASNTTLAGVLRALGLSTSPGHYRSLHHHIQRLGLSTKHHTGQAHGTSRPGRPLTELLVKGSHVHSYFKKRLIREGLIQEECSLCGLPPTWQNKPLVLQLDHINGDPYDNRLENLRLLCPNCHTQTPTFTKSGRGRYTPKKSKVCACGVVIQRRSKTCRACMNTSRPTKIDWPTHDELRHRVATSSHRQVAKELGVSDNAVRKRLTTAHGRC